MGAWNTSINGNDTAQDLRSEYKAAFFYNDVETALVKIDEYIRLEGFDESDEEEWCNYYYSLADFMWSYGLLTEEIRNKVITMIDSGFGLDIWEESGLKVLEKRKKVLNEFKTKILSQQPVNKKIRLDFHMNPIFENGDIIAIQLKTSDKYYIEKSCFSEDFFRDCDGKYIVLRKVCDDISYVSAVEPRVKDIWVRFQLYNKIFDTCPNLTDLKGVEWAKTENTNGSFITESSMFYFKKRNYKIIGSDKNNLDFDFNNVINVYSFGINKPWFNFESKILKAIYN